MIARLVAGLSLLTCIAVPFAFFRGQIGEGAYKLVLMLASIAWFVAATMVIMKKAPAD